MSLGKRALIAWLQSQALEAHDSEAVSRNGESCEYDDGVFAGNEEAYNNVIAHIRNTHTKELHRKLVEK
jgi:hypothetical protein